MDVVKLPMPVPECSTDIGSQFLFLRPDDYHLFYCMQQSDMTNGFILLGNPGISKSWFQFKYILFCYRPEIYNDFRPMKDDEDVDNKPEAKKPKVLSKEIPPSKELKGIKTIPQVIVRTIGGTKSQIFFVNTSDSVLLVIHQFEHLDMFTTQEMTILWEPGNVLTTVPYIGIKARMIATVSPFLDRFKEFKKDGALILHMPCPSKLQLRFMGQILRPFYSEWINSDVEIQRRVKSFGPFIRLVLNKRPDVLNDFINRRDGELGQHNSSQLINLVLQHEHVMVTNRAPLTGFSHRLVCYFVRRNNEELYFGYETERFRCACEEAFRAINSKISKPDIRIIQSHLVEVNTKCGTTSTLVNYHYKWFELLVEYYLGNGGLKWERYIIQLKQNKSKRDSLNSSTIPGSWEDFFLQEMDIVHDVVRFNKMDVGKMYVRDDLQFPLVDMYWKNENGELCGIQITKSKQHPKPRQVFQSFLQGKLGLKSMDIKFHLYFVIFPFLKEDFAATSLRPSSVYQKVKTMPQDFGKKFIFYGLSPPSTFDSNLKQHALRK